MTDQVSLRVTKTDIIIIIYDNIYIIFLFNFNMLYSGAGRS